MVVGSVKINIALQEVYFEYFLSKKGRNLIHDKNIFMT